ncbi:MAG: hypothetical protein OXH66_14370 [Gemmatimonadetes bacterium]|nr:hypothetical protein [Gemmatimonadota bacterium]
MALPWNLIRDSRWNEFLSALGDFIEDMRQRVEALETGDTDASVATLYDGAAFSGSEATWRPLSGSPMDDDYDLFLVTGVESSEIGTTVIIGSELRAAVAAVEGETVTASAGVALNTTLSSYGRLGRTAAGELLVGDRLGVQPDVSRLHIVGLKLG